MSIDFKHFGVWLQSGATQAEKLAACAAVIASSKDGSYYSLETLGKAGCHLAYRLIDRQHDDKEQAFAAAEWALSVCLGAVSEKPLDRTRWTGSLSIALAYLHLLHGGSRDKAAELCVSIMDEDAVETHPQNMLNIMRAAMLLAVYRIKSQNEQEAQWCLRFCRRAFRLGVAGLECDHQPLVVGDELLWASNMVKLSIGLGPLCGIPTRGTTHGWKKLADIEPSEPFRAAFCAMCGGLEWWNDEDSRYSWLYGKGYQPARPLETVEMCGIPLSASIVDLGCGRAELSKHFERYTGVDVSAFAVGENRKDRRGQFHHSSLHDLSCLVGLEFDAAVCSDVMEHIPPDKVDAVLQSIAGVCSKVWAFNVSCRPSGTIGPQGENLHLTVQSPEWWQAKLAEFFVIEQAWPDNSKARLVAKCRKKHG